MANAEANGFRVLPDPPGADELIGPALAAMPSWVTNHESAAGGFLRASNKAYAFARENPKATLRILWRMYPAAKPAGKSEASAIATQLPLLEARLNSMKVPADRKMCSFTEREWSTTASYFGMANQIRDFKPFYTNSLVQKANAFDAEAVRRQARKFKLD